jgi:hypothetical protein
MQIGVQLAMMHKQPCRGNYLQQDTIDQQQQQQQLPLGNQ